MTHPIFDFETQLGFYGQYHHNNLNKWIHIICVPIIFWSSLVFSAQFGSLGSWVFDDVMPLNVSVITTMFYSFYYLALEPVAGTFMMPLLIGECYTANWLVETNTFIWGLSPVKFAILVHVVGWVAQFVGHGVFEGRAPALLDNLFQAIVLAPFFVFVEVLFMFGYRPDLHKQLESHVVKKIAQYKASKKVKK